MQPFKVGVPEAAFTDRADEMSRVLDAMRAGGRLIVYGERRLGKTTLLRRAAERIAREGGVVVYVDAWAAADAAAVARRILEQLPRSWLLGERAADLLRTLAGMVTLGVSSTSGAPVIRLDPGQRRLPDDAVQRLIRALDGAAGHADGPVVLVLDEFQKLEDRTGIAPAELRGLAQECGHLAVILSGSAQGTIVELMAPDAPFYGVPALEVGPIDGAHLARWLRSKLERAGVEISPGASRRIVERAEGITSYVLELGNQVAAAAEGPVTPDVVDAAFRAVSRARAAQYELIWDGLNAHARNLLVALAHGEEALTGQDVRERYRLPASSTVVYHLDQLRARAILRPIRTPAIADPFFRAWIRHSGPGR